MEEPQPLESLCLNDADSQQLYAFWQTLENGKKSFDNLAGFQAHFANAENLQIMRDLAQVVDMIRQMGYKL